MAQAINNNIGAEATKEVQVREYWKWVGGWLFKYQKILKRENIGSRIYFSASIPDLTEFDDVFINGKKVKF